MLRAQSLYALWIVLSINTIDSLSFSSVIGHIYILALLC